jgi:asparagine synthase (glutamine-hydrolysing)
MCGIVGFTHRDSAPRHSILEAALREIFHRGPDQNGQYCSRHISLGAVRLKIIDLQYGDQPIRSEDGSSVVVFNGEIYNHAEIRTELEGLGHRFHSRCDTEVVLRAFLEWDIASFERLRGMFAFAIWNEREQRLVLCRDRAGMKPLYYFDDGEDISFCSELKGIFANPDIPRQISRDGLSYYLCLNYVPAPYTLVEGIRKVRPGHWLEWHEGRVTEEPYWQLQFSERKRPFPEAVEEFDALLRDSVREHMVADVPLGLWVSGGLDSSTMLHYASQATTSRLKTFSLSFPGRSFDETKYFRAAASHYGTEHYELQLEPGLDLAGNIEDMMYYSDEPSADAGALPVWFLSALTREHVTVALSGEGADELFAGYQTYLADKYASAYRRVPRSAREVMGAAVANWPTSDEKISFGYKLRRFSAGSLLSDDAAHCFWNGTFSDAEKHRLAKLPLYRTVDDLYEGITGKGLNRYLELDTRYYLADDILYKSDRMSMARSLELRVPFLDHRIMEFAAGLPQSFKMRGRKLKHILRELMRDKLPSVVVQRGKQGLDIPTHDWFRNSLRPFLLDVVTPDAVRATGIFNVAAVQGLIDRHLQGREDLGYHLWGLLILLLWASRWNIDFSPVQQRQEIYKGLSVH